MIGTGGPTTQAGTLPGLYDEWPGDPGPSPHDNVPFPMQIGERFQLWSTVFIYKRRATTGCFYFEPDDGAASLNRSAWRLRTEFAEGILVRLDRGRRANPSRAHDAATKGAVVCEPVAEPVTYVWKNQIMIPKIRQELERRQSEGLPKILISGPREKGGRCEPHVPPRNLAELVANLAQDCGIPPGEQRSWKTVAKTLACFPHVGPIPAHQLVDGRTIADHPRRTGEEVAAIALKVIKSEYATREFESISGTVERVNTQINIANKPRPSDDQLPSIGRTAVENLIKTLPGRDLCESKFNPKRAREVYDIVGKLPKPKEPMTVVEFDWHLIDLETKYPTAAKYLTELAGVPMSRLWLIAGVDRTTWWPVGYSWSVRAQPSAADIMRAFAHMCRHKPSYSQLGVEGEWLAGGFSKVLKMDHGKANLARDVLRAADNFGIEIDLDESKNPKKRPFGERFFGFVETDFISKLPGAIGRNVQVRPEQRANPGEMLAIDELDRRFIQWVCNRFANHTARTRPHSARDAWLIYQNAHPGWSPDTARSEEELNRELRISIECRATREGLVWLGVPFNGPAVEKLRSDHHAHSKGNPVVEMRMHPDEITDVIVRDPHKHTGGWKKYPEIMCLSKDYAPGKSMDVHEIVHAAATAAKKKRAKITEELLAETYVAVTRRAVEKVMKRSAARRSVGEAARLGQLTTFGNSTSFPKQQETEPRNREAVPLSQRPQNNIISDPTNARDRLMASWPNPTVAPTPSQPRTFPSTHPPKVHDDEY